MKKYLRLLSITCLAVVYLFIMEACQTVPYQPYARDVKKRPTEGGVIALKLEHRDEDRTKADQMMRSNCANKKIKVLEEGEVVIGQKTNSSSNQSYDNGSPRRQVGALFGVPVISGSDPSSQSNAEASTTQLKEWQISYECANNVAEETTPTPAKRTAKAGSKTPVSQ